MGVYFVFELYVYETHISMTDRVGTTLMIHDDDNSSIVGVLVYTFFYNYTFTALLHEACYPRYLKVTNHTT